MSKKHKLDASHPGVGKSKIMKKLAKKLKRKYVDVPMQKEWMRHLDAFAALAGYMPKPSDTRFRGMNTKQVFDILMKEQQDKPKGGNRPEDGVGEALRRFIHTKPTMPGMVEHMDALVTFWDGQLDDMSGGFHLLRDRLVNAEDHATLKLMDELLHRVIEVRCQLDTMKKDKN